MVQPPDGFDLLSISDPGLFNGFPQDGNRLIVDPSVDRVRMTVFPSMGKAETGWIFETRFGPTDQFRDEAQGPKGLGTHAGIPSSASKSMGACS